MKRYIWLWVMCLSVAGCALPLRTQGVAGPASWSMSDYDLESSSALDGDRNRFSFILTLQETQGQALTITAVTWEVWQNGVDLSGRQTRKGSWSLQANGVLRQPFVYHLVCQSTEGCLDVGPTTQWEIAFEGRDASGQAVRLALQAELPWIPPRAVDAPPHASKEASVELPAIDFTAPRLYYPRIEGK